MKTIFINKCLYVILILLLSFINVSAKVYKGGELRTIESYLYGRFEVKYKASAGSGQTSTFFTYNDDNPNTPWNEIDIEILGRYTNDVQFNTITSGQTNHVRHQFVNFNPQIDFHTYAMEWTPDYVAWFIDDVEAYRQTEEHIETLNISQKIMMNIWNPSYANWVGPWSDDILPKFAYYDYVSYASYTPGSGDSGTDNNFSFQWKDDFKNWDRSRWQKATHSFQGNQCDFLPDNVIFQDGYMILCLTDNVNVGYVDKKPPTVFWARASGNMVTIKFSEEIEKTGAETKSNYMISGVTIENLTLRTDNRTVELTVSGMELNQTYNLVVLGIEDTASPPNKLIGQSIGIVMPIPLSFPIKINVGGEAYSDYLADQEWNENVEYGYLDGSSVKTEPPQPIAGTEEDEIYQDVRDGLVTYGIRIPKGTYKITLMMAENNFDEPHKRIFDIFVEGIEVAENLDLYKEVGKNTAYDVVIDNAEIVDGIIDIHFCAVVNNALLNGLIIENIDSDVEGSSSNIPEQFYLSQNYPNPFNSFTIIQYKLPDDGFVTVNIYDTLGKKLTQLLNNYQEMGTHKLSFGTEFPSGIYFYKIDFLSNGELYSKVNKMILLK